jgi:hypothetical protein
MNNNLQAQAHTWRLVATGLAVAGAVFLVAAEAMTRIGQMPGGLVGSFWGLIVEMDPLVRIGLILLVMSLLAVVLLGFVLRSEGRDALPILVWSQPGLGLAAAAYGGWNISVAYERVGGVSLPIMAPGIAEAVLVAAIGCFGGALAAFVNSRANSD